MSGSLIITFGGPGCTFDNTAQPGLYIDMQYVRSAISEDSKDWNSANQEDVYESGCICGGMNSCVRSIASFSVVAWEDAVRSRHGGGMAFQGPIRYR